MAKTPKPSRLSRFVLITLQTAEAIVLSIPGLFLTVLVNPGPPLTALKWFLIGLAWLWIGDFLIRHSTILHFILETIQIFATVAGKVFGDTVNAIEIAIDAAVAIANVGGDLLNGIGSLFGDDHIVKKIPSIPIKSFPPIDFSSFLTAIEQLGNATKTCEPFNDVGFELAFPLRSLLNDHFCPVVRYTWSSIVYPPFSWLLGFGHFSADPNANNCTASDAWIVCFWLKFGLIIAYVLAPLHVLWWLFPAIKRVILDGLKLLGTGVGLVFGIVTGILHESFRSIERKKRY